MFPAGLQLELQNWRLRSSVYVWILVFSCSLAACQGLPSLAVQTPEASVNALQVNLTIDGETRAVQTQGSIVRDVLREQNVELSLLDRIVPSEITPLQSGLSIEVIRVTEVTEIEEVEIAFEKQLVRNEGLAEGETRLLQTGVAGLEELTYKASYENDVLVSRVVTRRELIRDSIPEIQMVGIQTTITAIDIPGTMAYLSAGNAWLVTENTGERTPLTTAGDLDGRVFALSSDGNYLLFTRATGNPQNDLEDFNTLWAINTQDRRPTAFALDAVNVLWAGWLPGQSNTVAYATGQPTLVAPGWDADNNLRFRAFTADERLSDIVELIPSDGENEALLYGTRYTFSNDGLYVAFANAIQVGWVAVPTLDTVLVIAEPTDDEDDAVATAAVDAPQLVSVAAERVVLHTFAAYDTKSDWNWIPDVSWSEDNQFIYTVDHGAPLGLETVSESQVFDVMAISTLSNLRIPFVPQSGMWAAPIPAPDGQSLAYLQAMRPLESVSSRYRLSLVDRDGSNPEFIFPADGQPGLAPQPIVWSPNGDFVALTYAGDLWVLDVASGLAQPITADAQTSLVSWAN